MSYKVVVASVLFLAAGAFAQDGGTWSADEPGEPYVGDSALAAELVGVEASLASARARLRALLAAADVGMADAAAASYGVSEATTDQGLAGSSSGTAVRVARRSVDQAKERLAAAKDERTLKRTERRLARQGDDDAELSRAKQAVSEASKGVRLRREDRAAAWRNYDRIAAERNRSRLLQKAPRDRGSEDLDTARRASAQALDRVDVQVAGVRRAALEVVALEARRERVLVQIDYEHALRAGSEAPIGVLADSLAAAREAEAHTAARLADAGPTP